jgi:hypothetical protein
MTSKDNLFSREFRESRKICGKPVIACHINVNFHLKTVGYGQFGVWQSAEQMPSNANLEDGVGGRVAKNLRQSGSVHPLVF